MARRVTARFRRLYAGMLALVVGGGCGGATRTDNAPPPPAPDSSSLDPLDMLPRFPVELVEEVKLGGPSLAAESLLVRKENIEIHTRDGFYVFSMTGELGDSKTSQRATGADGYYNASGEFMSALVIDKALIWLNFEPTGVVLENVESATGLALGPDRALCHGCVYVADSPAQAVKEYTETGLLLWSRTVFNTDLEGITAAASGKIYVVDAKRRLLLRLDPRLEGIEAVAELPAAGGNVPTGLAFDAQGRLYVCFRDQNTLVVLKLPGEG